MRRAALAALLPLTLAGCNAAPATTPNAAPTVRLGLMTSLPLYWPLGTGIDALANGTVAVPWQRAALERRFAIEPLDTLSPIPGLTPDAPETDPLAGIDRLAVVQPRGLSPADNVALDQWVRGGGRLLLVLDPALTGDYDLPMGDPRSPVDAAPIPPVVARWGLAVAFDEGQTGAVKDEMLAGEALPLALAGMVSITDPAAVDCTIAAGGAAARCTVGKGRVTLIADAAIFEHSELAGEGGAGLGALVAAAFR
jgi:hypothetical protein